jgi:hypothetical protein
MTRNLGIVLVVLLLLCGLVVLRLGPSRDSSPPDDSPAEPVPDDDPQEPASATQPEDLTEDDRAGTPFRWRSWVLPQAPLTPTLVGTKQVTTLFRRASLELPWYRVTADHNAIHEGAIWPRVGVPEGTRTAYVMRYDTWRHCVSFDGGARALLRMRGLHFVLADEFSVAPGEGAVHVRWWEYDETGDPEADMVFREDEYYVVCLDREPAEQWRNGRDEPACDLETELPHITGIVEVRPAYDLTGHSPSRLLPLTGDSITAWRTDRCTVTREPDTHRFLVRATGGTPRPLPIELTQQLLYALHTCRWRLRTTPLRNPQAPSTIEYRDGAGERRTVRVVYDMGAWVAHPGGEAPLTTTYPELMIRVNRRIRELLEL